jgi:Xaa-Pro aminopeptidase
MEKARKAWPGQKPGPARVIAVLAKELRPGRFTVPEDFPAGLYKELKDLGIRLEIAEGPLFPEREVKTPAEALAHPGGQPLQRRGHRRRRERCCGRQPVRGGRLYYKGSASPASASRSRSRPPASRRAPSPFDHRRRGRPGLRPAQPRLGPARRQRAHRRRRVPAGLGTGFFGDMTRTFLRGRASDAQRDRRRRPAGPAGGPRNRSSAGVRQGGPPPKVTDVFAARSASRPSTRPRAPWVSSTAPATGSASTSTRRRA